MEVHMIEVSVYETTDKRMPLRRRLQFVRLIMVVILTLYFTMPLSSVAAPGTNSFTGSVTVPDLITFITTGSLNVARNTHTATLLKDGKVLVAGGLSYSLSFILSAELYDPASGIWSTTGSMSVGRADHTATLLNNGKVLVAGGGSDITELYDPTTGIWSTTGSMSVVHYHHTATLLDNGKVLVAGGQSVLGFSSTTFASAELYDPITGIWSTTGSMSVGRADHTATLLNNGKVLVAGGQVGSSTIASAELYDPDAGTWSTTGSMNVGRNTRTATLLKDGQVLVAGGYGAVWPYQVASAELYDPDAGTWSTTGSMNIGRNGHTTTLLNNGKVLVTGGWDGSSNIASTELYDPDAGTWSTTGGMNIGRAGHKTTLLNNGQVLVAGGGGIPPLDSAELGTLIPGNTFTGTLTLPSSWLNSTTISAQFVGASSAAAINAGALSSDNNTWGSWIIATSDEIIATTWDVGSEGANRPVYLRLRDINDRMATVVTGMVNVDLTKPTSTMPALPVASPANIPLAWSGSDALSGLSTYEVQVRLGTDGAWTDVLSSTTNTDTNYTGANGFTYYFRTRASDVAGNVEDWPTDYDTFTVVDTDAPSGMVVINGGALTTTAIDVTLSLSATDVTSGVGMMSFSNDGDTWSPWQSYATNASWALMSGDGLQTVYARFRDVAGNVSLPVSSTIELDTATEAEYGLTINAGALFTNQTAVALTLGAQPGTAQMQVSNDGGFADALWEPYASRKVWTITQYGNYAIPRVVYVRYKDYQGNTSATFSDDIILDVTPPVGSVTITPIIAGMRDLASDPTFQVGASSTQTFTVYLPFISKPLQVNLLLTATDDVSGVGGMLISNNMDFSGANWEAYASQKNWQVPSTGTTTVYVKFRDNAGNVSTTYSATYTP
jgi:hypothetical protein